MPLHILGSAKNVRMRRDDVVGFDQLQRAIGRHLVQTLADHPQRLAHLLHTDEVPIVDITACADRHLKVETIVDQIRLRLADVVVDAAAAEASAGQPVRNCCLWLNDTDAAGACDPDRVLGEEVRVLLLSLGEDLQEILDHVGQAGRNLP